MFNSKKNNDSCKFERIYEKYKNLMFKEAMKILNDRGDVEDAVQQSCERILKSLDKINEDEVGMTCNFLKVIVRNVSIDIYKKRSSYNTKEDNLDDFDEYIGTDKEVSDVVINNESFERIVNEIMKLPEKSRDILLLEKVYGYSREQTMKILNANYETLKKRMTRAKKQLLDALKKEGLNDGRENIRKNVR